MANRHSGEFSWVSHNGDGQLGHNGEKEEGVGSTDCPIAVYNMCTVQEDFHFKTLAH